MRKVWLVMTVVVAAMAAVSLPVKAQNYGPGYMMGPGYGGGYGPGHGYMRGPGYGGGYGPGYMMGPGYGYDRDNDRGYRRGRGNRSQRLCWTQTDSDRGYGYYSPCRS